MVFITASTVLRASAVSCRVLATSASRLETSARTPSGSCAQCSRVSGRQEAGARSPCCLGPDLGPGVMPSSLPLNLPFSSRGASIAGASSDKAFRSCVSAGASAATGSARAAGSMASIGSKAGAGAASGSSIAASMVSRSVVGSLIFYRLFWSCVIARSMSRLLNVPPSEKRRSRFSRDFSHVVLKSSAVVRLLLRM